MAVSPPFDILVQKAPIAISLLETQLFKVAKKLSEKVIEAAMDCEKMPKGISCSDPRVVRVKQILEQIQTLVQKIADILKIVNIVFGICVAVAGGAYAYIGFRLSVPTPSVPADIELLEAQKQIAANIITALGKIGIVIGVINVSVQVALAGLSGALNLISSICQDEEFAVFSATQNAIDFTSIANPDLSVLNAPDSKFYQTINVSEDDIKSRATAIDTLMKQQRSLLDLLEAPSRVIILTGDTLPNDRIGKAGDFAVNNDMQKIYGPKPSDFAWN
jgi:hypothetical protein